NSTAFSKKMRIESWCGSDEMADHDPARDDLTCCPAMGYLRLDRLAPAAYDRTRLMGSRSDRLPHRRPGKKEVDLVQPRPIRSSPIPSNSDPVLGFAGDRVIGPAGDIPAGAGDFPDLLGAITDRPDLEQLFARHVGLDSILRLMGRNVSREQIHDLL